MDHIPLPYNCPYRPMKVPYLDNTPDDYGDWHTYPQRHNWQFERDRTSYSFHRDGKKPSLAETAAFIQSWLYFGLLREIFGHAMTNYQFSQQDTNGRQILSTKDLDRLLSLWPTRFSGDHSTTEIKQHLEKLYQLLLEHYNAASLMHKFSLDLGDASIMLSIVLISERLMVALSGMRSPLGLETPSLERGSRLRIKGFPNFGQHALDLLQARGWCPYDTHRLDIEILHVSILCYYSNLTAPRSSKDHSRCSYEQCFAMLTDPSNYEPSHCNGCQGCHVLSASGGRVADILEKGSIPLVTVSHDSGSKRSNITIHDLAFGQEFVAISHVWAEGSGNVHNNALPTCLLEDISRLVRKLPWGQEQGDVAFWIDTLCVPVRPPELQTRALNMMRVPYERAKYVLVLDSHLRSLDSRQLSTTEIFAQVSCSSWMRRLWTLQEGRLAKSVWFQFANEAIDVRKISRKLDRSGTSLTIDAWMGSTLFTRLWLHIWHRGHSYGTISAAASSLHSIQHALASRSVSVPTDEALCLSTLMDKDITQVTAVPAVRRMEIFWRTFNKVPRGLLFSKVPSKMSEEGLHWAPRSFMGFQTEDEWFGPQELRCPREDEPHALPTNAGLQMALPGMTFHRELAGRMKELDLTWNMHLLVEDIQGIWCGLLLVESWRKGSSVIDTSQPLAMILAHELDPEKATAGRLSFNEATALDCSLGLLVSINKIENDVIYVTAHDHLLIQVLGKDSQKCQSVACLCAQEVNLPHSMILEETYEALKERYKTVAIRILGDSATHDAIARLCRARGGNGEYENVLDFLLNTVVNNARIGDRSKIQKIPDSQQWCVD